MTIKHPGMNRKDRDKIASLVRRRAYLSSLIERGEGNSFDHSEARALSWAIHRLTEGVRQQQENRP